MTTNPSIQCKVTDCKFNAVEKEYCTLDKILVGKQENSATRSEETDCESFKVKQSESMS